MIVIGKFRGFARAVVIVSISVTQPDPYSREYDKPVSTAFLIFTVTSGLSHLLACIAATISSSESGPSTVAGIHAGLSTSCHHQHDGAGGKNFGSVDGRDPSHCSFPRRSSSSL